MTRTPLILTDEAHGVRLGDLIDAKLICWGLNVFNAYIVDEKETKVILEDKKINKPTKK